MRLGSALRVWAIWLLAAGAAACVSYASVSWLLGFGWFGREVHPFAHVRGFRPELREVLVFDQGGHLSPERIDGFASALGIPSSTITALAPSHPDLIPLEAVIRLNPYPQVLRTDDYPYWLSVGYRSRDARYHQVTWYGGESDTTPSLLVKKVTLFATGWGDYFVRYTVKLSKPSSAAQLTRDAGKVPEWRSYTGGVQVEMLQWHAYRGGSYDGFEEGGFTLLGTLLLTPLLALVIQATMRRRLRSARAAP